MTGRRVSSHQMSCKGLSGKVAFDVKENRHAKTRGMCIGPREEQMQRPDKGASLAW